MNISLPSPFLLFISLSCLLACASRNLEKKLERHPDLSLIETWSDDLYQQRPFDWPFLMRFKDGGYKLNYIAAKHATSETSETFQLIRREIQTNKPKIIILEGFSRSHGLSPESMTKYAQKDKGSPVYAGGEVTFAILLANELKIPFVGAEPTESEVLKKLRNAGFSVQDILGYYFVRQVPQFKRQNALDAKAVEKIYDGFMVSVQKNFELAETDRLSFEKFKVWYSRKNKRAFQVNSIDTEESAPYLNSKYFTQKIAAANSRIRDEYIVRTISEFLRSHGEVLVIYGGSHLMCQKKTLESMLGPAIETVQ